ncbi:hypothetical protein QCD71_25160, partial [Sphingomonas sp. PsM26]|nr:hypothetical protein [Sphingomonas sp. PsM26]
MLSRRRLARYIARSNQIEEITALPGAPAYDGHHQAVNRVLGSALPVGTGAIHNLICGRPAWAE